MTVPEAAIDAATEAMDVGMWVKFDRRDQLELAMHVAIQAAMPALEQAFREHIAQEIEAIDPASDDSPSWVVERAARIVRGGTNDEDA